MPQKSLWEPTCALIEELKEVLSKKRRRVVKQNELIHEALLLYAAAPEEAAMTPEDIAAVCGRPLPKKPRS